MSARPAVAPSPAVAEQVELIPLELCRPSAYNPRQFPAKPSASLVELAISIRRTGQVQPATVRPIDGGLYEVVAGERRWRACRLRAKGEVELTPADAWVGDAKQVEELLAAGPAVEVLRAVVRELTDEQAMEICVTENLEREDLQPLEEANGVATLLQLYKGDVEAVASRLSHPVSWVAARARLLNLTPAWRKALVDETRGLHTWSTAHLVEIAKLEASAQNSLLDVYRYHAASVSVEDVRRRVRAELRTLGGAPFEILDAALVPKIGACSTCKTTSASTPGLFADEGDEILPGDLKRARCLNPLCWQQKAIAAAKAKLAELRSAGASDAAIVFDDYHQRHDLPQAMQQKARQVGGYSEYQRAKEGANGAWPGVYAVGEKAGKVEWFTKAQRPSSGHKKKAAGGEKTVTPLADRRKALEKRRIVAAVAKISVAVEKATKVPSAQEVAALAAAFGTEHRHEGLGDWDHLERDAGRADRSRWSVYDRLQKSGAPAIAKYLWERVRSVVLKRLTYYSNAPMDRFRETAWRIAALAGVDADALLAEAIAELPEPKSWKALAEQERAAKKAKPAAAAPPAKKPGKKKAAKR